MAKLINVMMNDARIRNAKDYFNYFYDVNNFAALSEK